VNYNVRINNSSEKQFNDKGEAKPLHPLEEAAAQRAVAPNQPVISAKTHIKRNLHTSRFVWKSDT
jgi:hypothetical protein